jgi:hypothetical protein
MLQRLRCDVFKSRSGPKFIILLREAKWSLRTHEYSSMYRAEIYRRGVYLHTTVRHHGKRKVTFVKRDVQETFLFLLFTLTACNCWTQRSPRNKRLHISRILTLSNLVCWLAGNIKTRYHDFLMKRIDTIRLNQWEDNSQVFWSSIFAFPHRKLWF